MKEVFDMRRCASILCALAVFYVSIIYAAPLSINAADIMPIANPTATSETFTTEEMEALLLSSEVAYKVMFMDGSSINGIIQPEILHTYLANGESMDNPFSIVYLPIEGMSGKIIVSMNIVFILPFTVKSLTTFEYKIAPASIISSPPSLDSGSYIFGDNLYPLYFKCYSFTTQIENSFEDVTDEIIHTDSMAYNVPSSFYTKPANCTYLIIDPDTQDRIMFLGSYDVSSSGFDFYTVNQWNSGMTFDNRVMYVSSGHDITKFGFQYSPGAYISYTEGSTYSSGTDNLGVAFLLSPISITYLEGGGYSPSGSDSDDPGISSDGGSYSEQLDKIYEQLVKDGAIQQGQNEKIIEGLEGVEDAIGELGDRIDQNTQDIIDNQNENTDKVVDAIGDIEDYLDNPSDDTQQQLDDQEQQFNEILDEIDQMQESLNVEKPDLDLNDYDFTHDELWVASVDDVSSLFKLFTDNFSFLGYIFTAVAALIIIRLVLYGLMG